MVLNDATRAEIGRILNDLMEATRDGERQALVAEAMRLQSAQRVETPDPFDNFRLGYDTALLDICIWARGHRLVDVDIN